MGGEGDGRRRGGNEREMEGKKVLRCCVQLCDLGRVSGREVKEASERIWKRGGGGAEKVSDGGKLTRINRKRLAKRAMFNSDNF